MRQSLGQYIALARNPGQQQGRLLKIGFVDLERNAPDFLANLLGCKDGKKPLLTD
jgi:hypothetical protein